MILRNLIVLKFQLIFNPFQLYLDVHPIINENALIKKKIVFKMNYSIRIFNFIKFVNTPIYLKPIKLNFT